MSQRSILFRAAAMAAVGLMLTASQAGAWASTGHRIISALAAASLPAELPAFLRDPAVVQQIGELGREPDRSRGAGQPHDDDLDPGHFIDLTDDGRVLGGPPITDMPKNRDAYSVVLHAAGSDLHKSGWLYYNLVDGYEQLVKDFAYYRADLYGERHAADGKERAWYVADRKLRELIIVRDLGYWSHFVGDASQPMHASVHYNGWGEYPNPNSYTQEHIHGPFEGAFVFTNLTYDRVKAVLPAPQVCADAVGKCMSDYLVATQARVEPLYALWSQGGFQPGDPRGVAFAAERVAEGAARLRDFVTKAWRDSSEATIGYPAVKVSAIESGAAALPFSVLYGDD